MQTFLPYPDFTKTALVLDRQRLGKQRVETLQILNALTGRSTGWVNHPATRMWRGYELALLAYGFAICDEWVRRGYEDSCKRKMIDVMHKQISAQTLPPWFGDDNFHNSHKSKLLQKDYAHYSRFDWQVPIDLDYVWPV